MSISSSPTMVTSIYFRFTTKTREKKKTKNSTNTISKESEKYNNRKLCMLRVGCGAFLVWYIETNKNSTAWLTIRIHIEKLVFVCVYLKHAFFWLLLLLFVWQSNWKYCYIFCGRRSQFIYRRIFMYCKKNSYEFSVQLCKKNNNSVQVVKDT